MAIRYPCPNQPTLWRTLSAHRQNSLSDFPNVQLPPIWDFVHTSFSPLPDELITCEEPKGVWHQWSRLGKGLIVALRRYSEAPLNSAELSEILQCWYGDKAPVQLALAEQMERAPDNIYFAEVFDEVVVKEAFWREVVDVVRRPWRRKIQKLEMDERREEAEFGVGGLDELSLRTLEQQLEELGRERLTGEGARGNAVRFLEVRGQLRRARGRRGRVGSEASGPPSGPSSSPQR